MGGIERKTKISGTTEGTQGMTKAGTRDLTGMQMTRVTGKTEVEGRVGTIELPGTTEPTRRIDLVAMMISLAEMRNPVARSGTEKMIGSVEERMNAQLLTRTCTQMPVRLPRKRRTVASSTLKLVELRKT